MIVMIHLEQTFEGDRVFKEVYIKTYKDHKAKLRILNPDKPDLVYIPVFKEDLNNFIESQRCETRKFPFSECETYEKFLHRILKYYETHGKVDDYPIAINSNELQ